MNEVEPDWKMMDQFWINEVEPALDLDSLQSSHPISVQVQVIQWIVDEYSVQVQVIKGIVHEYSVQVQVIKGIIHEYCVQ